MSLRIDIINARPFYHPGDLIAGNVTLDSKKSEDIAQVFINFTGRCKVKIRRHDHYTTISHRTRGYYFCKQAVVYDGGSYTFQSGTRHWPFTFTIPLEAEIEDPRAERPASKRKLDKTGILTRNDEGAKGDYFSSSPTWRGSYDSYRGRPDAHFLPDTFEYASDRFPASCEARVEYALTATLKRPTRGVLFPAKDLEASQEIILRSWNHLQCLDSKNGQSASSTPETQTVAIAQDFAAAHLASSQGAKMSKLSRAAMNVFKPSDLRPVNVDISVLLPRSFRPGALCQFRLQMSQAGNGSPEGLGRDEGLPPVQIQSYSLRLLARTALRGKQEHVMVQDVNHYAVDGRVLFSSKGLDLIIPSKEVSESDGTSPNDASNPTSRDGWLDLSATMPSDEADRQFMTPTFKTYNISREYELALEMKLECAGIKYEVKRDSLPVTIPAEEDYAGHEGAPRGEMSAEQVQPPSMDSKISSTDEKKGPVPPPPREEEPEALPKYEPGDVPDYEADHEQHPPS